MIEAHPDEALHEAERHVRDDAPLVAASLRVLARGEHAVALSPAEVFGNTEAEDLSHLHHRKALGVVDRGIVADLLQREAVVDRKSTRLNPRHLCASRMPASA